MLEFIPFDRTTYEKGNYIFEVLPDGVNIRMAVKKKPVTPESMLNMADWLCELALDLSRRAKP